MSKKSDMPVGKYLEKFRNRKVNGYTSLNYTFIYYKKVNISKNTI